MHIEFFDHMQYYQQKYNLNDFSYIWQFKNIFLSNELKKKSQQAYKISRHEWQKKLCN